MTRGSARELRKIRDYVRNAEREINRLGVVPRIMHKYPFDAVALATLSKAFAIAKACLRLLSADFADEAYGLARSLVECTTNLRYFTAVPEERDKRSRDFVRFAKADKSFWYHHALASAKTPKEKAEVRSYAERMDITDNPKLARQHWSGQSGSFVWDTTVLDHPLDGARTVEHRKKVYAVDYYLTSAYVHCSLAAIDNYYAKDGVPFRTSAAATYRKTHNSTLFAILVHLHDAIKYVLYGLNTDTPARLDAIYNSTLQTMVSGQERKQRKPS